MGARRESLAPKLNERLNFVEDEHNNGDTEGCNRHSADKGETIRRVVEEVADTGDSVADPISNLGKYGGDRTNYSGSHLVFLSYENSPAFGGEAIISRV